MTPIIVHPFENMTDEDCRNARTAAQCFYHGRHGNTRLERENCSACVLQGYEPRGGYDDDFSVRRDGPNYCGWARLYVETRRTIPHKWREAFRRELDRTDNARYVEALKHDIAVFGLRIA